MSVRELESSGLFTLKRSVFRFIIPFIDLILAARLISISRSPETVSLEFLSF